MAAPNIVYADLPLRCVSRVAQTLLQKTKKENKMLLQTHISRNEKERGGRRERQGDREREREREREPHSVRQTDTDSSHLLTSSLWICERGRKYQCIATLNFLSAN